MNVTLTLNGDNQTVTVEPDEMLMAVLRRLGLRSVRETCGIGVCGSCTVLVDGRPMSGCLLLAPLADGSNVVTAEGWPTIPSLLRSPIRMPTSAAGAYLVSSLPYGACSTRIRRRASTTRRRPWQGTSAVAAHI